MSCYFSPRKRLQTSLFAITSLFLIGAATSPAATINDPAGDFLPSYAGPQNGDLDVLNAEVFFDGSNFTFTSTQNAAVGTTTGGIYVWGINRGAGMAGFPTIAPGVLFDSVFVINPSGSSVVRDLISGTATPIADITISGSSLSGVVPLSALPSQAFAPGNYQVNLWPRSPGAGDSFVSDFAPDNSTVSVTVTPEPATLPLFALASLMGVFFLKRRFRSVR